jgi:hypothetical protein
MAGAYHGFAAVAPHAPTSSAMWPGVRPQVRDEIVIETTDRG